MAEEDMPDVTEAAARVNGLNLRIENGQVVAGAIAPAGGAAPAGGPAPAGAGSAAPAVQVPPAALAGVHQAAAAAGAVVGGVPPVPGAAVPGPHAQVVENNLANNFNQATQGIMAYVANNHTASDGRGKNPLWGSGMRANLPPIVKWKSTDVLSRDVDLFLTDCLAWARAGRQANINGVTQHIADDGLRHVMTLKLNSLVSTDEGKDWAEVCKVFKDLVGTHLVSEEQRMRAQLTGGQVTQGRDTVAVYCVRFRTYRLRLPEVPESMLCLYFGNGLKGSLKMACARTPEGKVWESLEDLMQYAIGQEGRETASGASALAILPTSAPSLAADGTPVAAFTHGRAGPSRGGSRGGRGGRFGRGRGRAQHAAMFGGGRGGGSAGAGPSCSGGGRGGRGGRGGQGSQGNQGGRAGQGGQGGRGNGNGNGNNEACFNCGGIGHRSFQCPSPPAKRQRGDEQH